MRNRPGSFTIIELLITMAIFAVVSAAVYATFSSGMNVWRRLRDTGIAQEKILLRNEKFSRELRQAFNFTEIGFSGSKNRIYFPAVIDSELTRITYFFEADKKAIFRSSERLADIIAAKSTPAAAVYLANTDNLNFSYFYFDSQKSAYLWKDDWQAGFPAGMPLAVKLNIASGDKTYETTIFIPAA